MFPRPRTLCHSLAALCLLLGAGQVCAAPNLRGIDFGEYLCGARPSLRQLRHSVVVFVDWDMDHPETALSITDLMARHKPESLTLVINQCREGTAKQALKAWREATTQGDKAVVIHRGHLGGDTVTPVDLAPKVRVFNALGMLVYEGKPTDDKCGEAIAAAIRLTTGVSSKQASAQMRMLNLFGDKVHTQLVPVATLLADPKRPSAKTLALLERATHSKKEPIVAAQAQVLIDDFNKAIAERFAMAQELVKTDPAQARAMLDELADWVPQKEEGAKAKAQLRALAKDPAFLDELAAEKLWVKLEEQGDKLDFVKNPKQQPLPAMQETYAALVKKYPASVAATKARESAPQWHLDPATGKFAPPPAGAK